jgi:hypothetical protein
VTAALIVAASALAQPVFAAGIILAILVALNTFVYRRMGDTEIVTTEG